MKKLKIQKINNYIYLFLYNNVENIIKHYTLLEFRIMKNRFTNILLYETYRTFY